MNIDKDNREKANTEFLKREYLMRIEVGVGLIKVSVVMTLLTFFLLEANGANINHSLKTLPNTHEIDRKEMNEKLSEIENFRCETDKCREIQESLVGMCSLMIVADSFEVDTKVMQKLCSTTLMRVDSLLENL